MSISVFGAGNVGLVQAALLANFGHEVFWCMSVRNKSNCFKAGVMQILSLALSH